MNMDGLNTSTKKALEQLEKYSETHDRNDLLGKDSLHQRSYEEIGLYFCITLVRGVFPKLKNEEWTVDNNTRGVGIYVECQKLEGMEDAQIDGYLNDFLKNYYGERYPNDMNVGYGMMLEQSPADGGRLFSFDFKNFKKKIKVPRIAIVQKNGTTETVETMVEKTVDRSICILVTGHREEVGGEVENIHSLSEMIHAANSMLKKRTSL